MIKVRKFGEKDLEKFEEFLKEFAKDPVQYIEIAGDYVLIYGTKEGIVVKRGYSPKYEKRRN